MGSLLPPSADPALPYWRPGQAVELQIARGGETHVLKFRIGVNQEISFQIEEDPQAGADQLQVREGWLKGVTHSSSGKQ